MMALPLFQIKIVPLDFQMTGQGGGTHGVVGKIH